MHTICSVLICLCHAKATGIHSNNDNSSSSKKTVAIVELNGMPCQMAWHDQTYFIYRLVWFASLGLAWFDFCCCLQCFVLGKIIFNHTQFYILKIIWNFANLSDKTRTNQTFLFFIEHSELWQGTARTHFELETIFQTREQLFNETKYRIPRRVHFVHGKIHFPHSFYVYAVNMQLNEILLIETMKDREPKVHFTRRTHFTATTIIDFVVSINTLNSFVLMCYAVCRANI